MGIVYYGPYAEQVGYHDHEGYATRWLPNGEPTGVWTYETREFVGYTAACACGWSGTQMYEPTEAGEELAHEEWHREHLRPLVEQAAHGWNAWADRVGTRARAVARHVIEGRLGDAIRVLERLRAEVDTWTNTAAQLRDEQENQS